MLNKLNWWRKESIGLWSWTAYLLFSLHVFIFMCIISVNLKFLHQVYLKLWSYSWLFQLVSGFSNDVSLLFEVKFLVRSLTSVTILMDFVEKYIVLNFFFFQLDLNSLFQKHLKIDTWSWSCFLKWKLDFVPIWMVLNST